MIDYLKQKKHSIRRYFEMDETAQIRTEDLADPNHESYQV